MLGADSRVAVIGSSGFIGGAAVRTLDRGGIPVVGYTRSDAFLTGSGELADGIAEATVIFWLASSIRPGSAEQADSDHKVLDELLTALERASSRARILAISSGGTVYDTELSPPYSEQSPTRAANQYGEAMLAMEALLRRRWPDHVVLRASNAYGPGQLAQRGQGVIAHWLDRVRRRQPLLIMGDPQVERDYIYIDDLVEALLAAAGAADVPRLLNIGSGAPTSLAELAETVRDVVGSPVQVLRTQARSFDAPNTWLDVSLAARAIGWLPRTELRAGIAETWQQSDRG